MPSMPPAAFDEWIRTLESKHLEAQSYREGCYELAGVARRRWSRAGHTHVEKRTAKELHRSEGDTVLSRFLLTLAKLRFRKQGPDSEDFQAVCELAIAADRAISGRPRK